MIDDRGSTSKLHLAREPGAMVLGLEGFGDLRFSTFIAFLSLFSF